MTNDLYIEYKSATGKEPIVQVEQLEVLSIPVIKTSELETIATSEDDKEFYTCDYVEWLERKVEGLE